MAFQDGLGHWGLCGDGAPMNAEDRLALVTVCWVDKGKMAVLARAPSIRGHRASQSCWGSPSALLSSGHQSPDKGLAVSPRQISSHEAGKNLSMAVSHQHGFPQPSQLAGRLPRQQI